jgi:hypothetical protein
MMILLEARNGCKLSARVDSGETRKREFISKYADNCTWNIPSVVEEGEVHREKEQNEHPWS